MLRPENNSARTVPQQATSDQAWMTQLDPAIHLSAVQQWMQKFGSPLHVYSERALQALATGFLHFAKASARPAQTAFAIKACPSATVLSLLRQRGLLAEVNSVYEYYMARAAGFAPQQIHINGVAKSLELVDLALLQGCRALHIDAVEEIDIVGARARALGRDIALHLRICPDVASGRSRHLMTGSTLSPFGIVPDDLPHAWLALQQYRAHLRLVGLHVHVGSGGDLAQVYPHIVQVLGAVYAASQLAGFSSVQEINLGGGFVSDEACFSQVAGSAALLSAIQKLPKHLHVMFEPGRFLVEHASALYSRIAAMKRKAGHNWIFLDAGYCHLTDRAITSAQFPIQALHREPMQVHHTTAVQLAGPLCDAADIYQSESGKTANFAFPMGTRVGDVVEIARTGAYVYSTGNHFAGFGQPAVLLIDSEGRPRLMRCKEQLADLCALEVPA